MKRFQWLRTRTAKLIRFLRGREPVVFVAVLLAVLGIWGFIELADEVTEGSTRSFDRWVVASLRQPEDPASPLGPPWMGSVGRDLTALGGVPVLILFIFAAAGFLAVNRAYRTMMELLVSTGTGILLSLLLKRVYARPRPDLVPHLDQVYTSSFPSGHAMMSALVYLTLGALLTTVLKGFWVRCYVLSLCIALSGVVGLSRIYMGVHYPTDVLAGWAVGSAWAIVCWLLARQLNRRTREQF